MRLSWHKGLTSIIVHYSDGTNSEWSGGTWSRVSNILSDKIFETINRYWESLPSNQVLRFENCYRNMFTIFEDNIGSKELTDLLKPHVSELLSLFNWTQFRLWCILHGNLNLANGIKDTMDDKDKEGLTYYTDEYTDLMVFSVMLKSIMPIWGRYHLELEELIGKYYIHIHAIKLIQNIETCQLPPMVKLESYIECFADIKITKTGFSIVSGIGSEEIPLFLLSLALIKKVVIYDVQDIGGHIVKNVYHVLSERCKEIATSRPIQKTDTDNEGGDVGIADRYKIVQRIAPAVSTMLEHDGKDVYRTAKIIDPTVPRELVQKYDSGVSTSLDIMNYHLPLIGLVCNKVISARSLKLVPYVTILNYIKVSAAILEHWGFIEISELLTVIPIKKDIYHASALGSSNSRSYNQLTSENLLVINNLYPFISNGRNPGASLLDSLIKEMIKYDWRVRSENFDDMRNSVARLMNRQLSTQVE